MTYQKTEWERSCQDYLRQWQKVLQQGQDVKSSSDLFFNELYNAPRECHFLSLQIEFSARDMKEFTWHQKIEHLGVAPFSVSKSKRKYNFPLFTPRWHDWSKSGFTQFDLEHGGSPVREYATAHPPIETIKYYWGSSDYVTNQHDMLLVQPLAHPFLDRFLLFPRNLTNIAIHPTAPAYAAPDFCALVEGWYQQEFSGKV